MTVNKELLDRVIYRSTKSVHTGTQEGRVFEEGLHGIDALNQINYTSLDVKSLVNTSLDNNEVILKNLGEAGVKNSFYISVVASQLYNLMLNFVKIPTNQKITNEKTDLYVCVISMKPQSDPFIKRKVLNALCFIGLPMDTEIIIESAIYKHLTQVFQEALIVDVLSKHDVNYKFAPMDKIDDDYDLISITRQENYAKRCREILSYKKNNPETSQDNSRLDNLQYHLLEQQLCFALYLSLQPVLALSIVKFNRSRNLADATGNLFLSFLTTNTPLNDVDRVSLINLVHIMMDYGFYISYDNIENNIKFLTTDVTYEDPLIKDQSIEDREAMSKDLGKNSMYALLFRLLDEKISNDLKNLDDLILSKKYAEFDAEILKILS